MRRICHIIYIGISLLGLACGNREFQPQEGDLLFQADKESAMSQAITAATGQRQTLSFTHVAIACVEDDRIYVLEAAPENGVAKRPLADFLKESAEIGGQPAVIVARFQGPDAEQVTRDAVARAKSFLGQPYDHSFLPDNGKLYCSELVWECYRDPHSNAPLFMSRPMNFRAADGTLPSFWVDHFAALGEPVPEGVAGTNPNDLLQERGLKIVHRYYQQ